MRVTADLGLCQGHQMCLLEAPELFGFDDRADQVVVLQEHPDPALARKAATAVQYCPTQALALVDDPHDQEGR
jgi:ferredoxin